MMDLSAELLDRLCKETQLCIIDLLTITLWDKTTVFRFTNLPYTFKCGDYNYLPLAFDIGGLKQGIGFDVDTRDVTFYYNSDDTIVFNNANTTLAKAIRAGAFRWATVEHSQVFLTSWAFKSSETYRMIIWKGRFKLDSASRSVASIKIKSFTDIMTTKTPPNIFIAGCINATYSTACGLNEDDFTTAYTLSGGCTKNILYFPCSKSSNYYTGGYVYVSGGSNFGAYRTIKSYSYNSSTGLGTAILRKNLASAPNAGDTIAATAGCDHTIATCKARFNNYVNCRAFPYIPNPYTNI